MEKREDEEQVSSSSGDVNKNTSDIADNRYVVTSEEILCHLERSSEEEESKPCVSSVAGQEVEGMECQLEEAGELNCTDKCAPQEVGVGVMLGENSVKGLDEEDAIVSETRLYVEEEEGTMEKVLEGNAVLEETGNGPGEMDVEEETADVNKDVEGEESVGETEGVDASYYYWKYEVPECYVPKCLITSSSKEFEKEEGKKGAEFTKGCKWAPDGSCLLSSSDDDCLRLFNFPKSLSAVQDWRSEDNPVSDDEDWSSVLRVKEGGLVYDYCWYPLMSSVDPVSCCFLTSSSQAPIHLWDAFTGKLRASYQPFNHLEQLISAYSLAFDPTGVTIYGGFEKAVRIFDITRPGKECTVRPLKQTLPDLNQYGIIASITVNPSLRSFYAVGSFDKTIGLYYVDGSVICLLQGHIGGITHMKFSNDGLKLFTGGRKDSRLMCWDMRNMGEAYQIFERVVSTHQRIYFDVTSDDRYLISGGTDGVVKIWDLLKNEEAEPTSFRASTDCVNGMSLNPYIPLLATSSGQRHFLEIADDSDEDELFVKSAASHERSCDIKLWKLA